MNILILLLIKEMDQLPSDMLLCILTYIDIKTLISVCIISYKFVELNLESLLRQRLTQLSRLNLKNHNLRCLINLSKFPFRKDRIIVGGNHSIILNNDGQIYTFGHNNKGQLGLGDNIKRNIPTLMPNIRNLIAITTGRFHSMILNERGQIYTFGHNGYGQLGLGDDTSKHNPNRNTPTLIRHISNIIAITAGGLHSMILNERGQIYTFGDNGCGQLGLGDNASKHNTNRNTPTLIPNISNIIAITAGGLHSMILNERGQIYTFGANNYGQLGLGDNDSQHTPTIINDISNIIAILAGRLHSMILNGG